MPCSWLCPQDREDGWRREVISNHFLVTPWAVAVHSDTSAMGNAGPEESAPEFPGEAVEGFLEEGLHEGRFSRRMRGEDIAGVGTMGTRVQGVNTVGD